MHSRKLHIGNLGKEVTHEDVDGLISDYVSANNLKLMRNSGIALVKFDAAEEAENAIDELDGSEFKGRIIKVQRAPVQNEMRSQQVKRENSKPLGKKGLLGYRLQPYEGFGRIV
ncbi:MAG: hypothetical protein ACYS8W_07515 [Planctomycetota bacterium]|jgi:RNA recognition motif-containing protein